MQAKTGVAVSGGLLPAFRASVADAQLCEMDFPLADQGASMALDSVQIDDLSVARYRSLAPQSVLRRQDHIRRDGLDSFIVTLPLSADFHFYQQGSRCSIAPGAFALVSTARPFEIAELPNSAQLALTSLHVVVPGPLLRERCKQADALCSRALPILPGAGRMMHSLVAAWLSDGALLSPSQARSACDLLLDLIAAACIENGPSEHRQLQSSPDDARQRTLQAARRFIDAHISNPALDTTVIAGHCRVSVRQLQKIFESAALSVAATIREKRLQGSRDSLLSHELRYWTIAQIAAGWGFDEPSQFSRAYRIRFGRTPTEERNIALGQCGNSSG